MTVFLKQRKIEFTLVIAKNKRLGQQSIDYPLWVRHFSSLWGYCWREWCVHVCAHVGVRVCVCVCACMCVHARAQCSVIPDCLWLLCCSTPGSSVHGIFQARILDLVAISSSRGSSPPRDQSRVSCVFYPGRWVNSLLQASPMEKAMAPTPVLSPAKSQGQRSLVGCSAWGRTSRTRLKWLAAAAAAPPGKPIYVHTHTLIVWVFIRMHIQM